MAHVSDVSSFFQEDCSGERAVTLPVVFSPELSEGGEVHAREPPSVGSDFTSTVEGRACSCPRFHGQEGGLQGSRKTPLTM